MPQPQAPVGSTAAVLRLLSRHPHRGATVRQLTTALKLPGPTARDLLESLRAEGLVQYDAGTAAFRPAGPLRPAAAPDRPDCNDVRAAAMTWADRLAADSGMSVCLAVPHAEGAQVIHHVFRPDNTPQRLATGDIRPASSALARALAVPDGERCVHAADTGCRETASLAVAVPCPCADGCAAALGLTGPRSSLDPAGGQAGRYEGLLREAARAISSTLALAPAR